MIIRILHWLCVLAGERPIHRTTIQLGPRAFDKFTQNLKRVRPGDEIEFVDVDGRVIHIILLEQDPTQ